MNAGETYWHRPMDYAKTLKPRFRVGDLDLPERRKRYTSSREEKEDTQMYPCGKPCLLYTSPSPRDQRGSRMPSSA